MASQVEKQATSAGVRTLKLDDQAPACDIVIDAPAYELADLVAGCVVLDIGCGQGRNRELTTQAGGTWIGLEPFGGGAHTLVGDAERLPVAGGSIDVVIMDAVLEHIPDVGAAFSEVARALKPGGVFVGYAAFMECFHEISYSHLSFKALEYYAAANDMKLERISGGKRFGIDYHLAVTMHPIRLGFLRDVIAGTLRSVFRAKAAMAYLALRFRQKRGKAEAERLARLYFDIECLRQSNGFGFVIERNLDGRSIIE